MKLVRFNGGKTGLMVQLASGPHVIDVIGSLGLLSPDDPISQGILNGILKDKGSWAPLIEHWEQARTDCDDWRRWRRRILPAASGHLPR